MNDKSISVIIPAYNEGVYIKDLVEEANKSPLVNQIIIVNDGSNESFSRIYDSIPNSTTLHLKKNLGKDLAMYEGLKSARSKYLLFIDADLQGFSKDIFYSLSKYLYSNTVLRIVRGKESSLFKFLGTAYLNAGITLIDVEILKANSTYFFDGSRWGFETKLNQLCSKNKISQKFLEVKSLNHQMKHLKYGLIRGLISDLKMLAEIFFRRISIPIYIRLLILNLPEIKKREIID